MLGLLCHATPQSRAWVKFSFMHGARNEYVERRGRFLFGSGPRRQLPLLPPPPAHGSPCQGCGPGRSLLGPCATNTTAIFPPCAFRYSNSPFHIKHGNRVVKISEVTWKQFQSCPQAQSWNDNSLHRVKCIPRYAFFFCTAADSKYCIPPPSARTSITPRRSGERDADFSTRRKCRLTRYAGHFSINRRSEGLLP